MTSPFLFVILQQLLFGTIEKTEKVFIRFCEQSDISWERVEVEGDMDRPIRRLS